MKHCDISEEIIIRDLKGAQYSVSPQRKSSDILHLTSALLQRTEKGRIQNTIVVVTTAH